MSNQTDKQAEKAGHVNFHDEPQTTPAPDPERQYVEPVTGEDVGIVPDEKLPRLDPLKEAKAGTLSGDPESPHLGARYVPGSANTAPDGNKNFSHSRPPKRVKR